jgi:hypothetical protein
MLYIAIDAPSSYHNCSNLVNQRGRYMVRRFEKRGSGLAQLPVLVGLGFTEESQFRGFHVE